ncbi:3'(2'),5'-bisphosphate nucleotidase CysQ [Pontibacter liquoris]|uniref:3'(2'),5'-bisphosphate nucleotidase CysQ n=1 Tax=Pontibacter liquoris TaxID=2905677 RepID=UPI001FA7D159|nr:3'(2'),5'-bisphosphate nucleotidase CysQ [Pontibacter liquoris]
MINTELIINAALKAGQKVNDIYNENSFTVELKEDLSPLTMADKASHEIIAQILKETPYPVISEESRNAAYSTRKQWPVYWLLDPLDGTKEFIKRNGEFTINIALIKHKEPVMGVVYAPIKKWLYIGIAEEGAWKLELADHALPNNWKEQAQLLPLTTSEKKRYTVVGSRSHASKETDDFVAGLETKYGDLSFISMGSSLKLCLVAEGLADIYPRLAPTMEWDTAAGDAIARSAGCKVVQYINGEPLQYNKVELLNPWFVVQR